MAWQWKRSHRSSAKSADGRSTLNILVVLIVTHVLGKGMLLDLHEVLRRRSGSKCRPMELSGRDLRYQQDQVCSG